MGEVINRLGDPTMSNVILYSSIVMIIIQVTYNLNRKFALLELCVRMRQERGKKIEDREVLDRISYS